MPIFSGRCHCGNLHIEFDSAIAPADFEVRACACSFCRKHGARTVSDPNGQARIQVQDSARLHRYRFALRTADFLVCRACGVYVGAAIAVQGKSWSTLNINAFDQAAAFARTAAAVRYDAETEEQRLARRMARWTPTEIVEDRP